MRCISSYENTGKMRTQNSPQRSSCAWVEDLCSPARVESSSMSSAQRSGVKGPPVIDLTDQRNDVVNLIDEDVNTYDREPMAGGTAVLGMKKRHSVADVTVKQPQQKSSRKVTS
jgi:hypothetical protein